MKDLATWISLFGGMSGGALATLIVLAGFGLAAFAIYAVLIVAKERK